MSPRSIASGNISFGLVSIPVKLFAPIDSSRTIRFNQIHEECGSRIRQQLYCPACEKVVDRSEVVKGYEFSKGQYVLFAEDELKGLLAKPTHAIEISEFVPLQQVDPIYFEKAYYLGPDKGGGKPYRLLARTLKETSRAALAQYAARGKQYLVLVRPFEEGLIMQQLYYADEIRDFSEIPLGDAEVRDEEVKLARQLVEQTARDDFEPEAYQDEIRDQILHLIQQKIEGEEVTAADAEPSKAEVVDLMDALKASLAESDEERKPPKRAARSPREEKRKAEGGGS